jgi:hypothetical protein
METTVFAFLVHDSDVAVYWLYQNGTLADEFNSAPDYFDKNISDQVRQRVRGNSERLLPLCLPGTTIAGIEEVIHPKDGLPLMAEGIFNDLAMLLGIDDTRMSLGFTYFESEGEEILPDINEWEPVGEKAERKNPSPKTQHQPPAGPMPDMFPVAIGMLIQRWSGKHEEQMAAFQELQSSIGEKPMDLDRMLNQMRDACDRGARDYLKHSQLAGRPTIQELKAARDNGPEALAKLLAERTPTVLADIASIAVREGLEKFLAALLANGLDPNAKDHHGNTALATAEKLGAGSPIYLMLKSAAER